jgi:hypothetical protein
MENKKGHELLKEREAQFRKGLEIVAQNARLTENGNRLFKTLELCAFE